MAHENSPYADSNVFDDLERDVQDFQCRYNCTILLVGDFNSRTGQMQDFVQYDKYIFDDGSREV